MSVGVFGPKCLKCFGSGRVIYGMSNDTSGKVLAEIETGCDCPAGLAWSAAKVNATRWFGQERWQPTAGNVSLAPPAYAQADQPTSFDVFQRTYPTTIIIPFGDQDDDFR